MQNKILWHQVVLFFVLFGLAAVRWLTGRLGVGLDLLWWWLGGIIGFLFVFSDRLVYALANSPEEVLSLKIKELFSKGHLAAGLALTFAEREKQKHLMMRSALFVVIWAVLAIFTATSVANSFSRGFVLGLGTHLLFDMTWDYIWGSRDIDLWFWQIRKVTKTEIDWFFRISFMFYVFILWFL